MASQAGSPGRASSGDGRADETAAASPAQPPAELLSAAKLLWQTSIIPALEDFIRIPCLSPDFDPKWEEHGHITSAARLITDWARNLGLKGSETQVLTLPGLTPMVVVDVAAWPPGGGGATGAPTLLYGHLDKQPPGGRWRIGAGPYTPTRKGDRLYGRGAADDGYAVFAALGALRVLQQAGIGHGRCVVIVEASEESMSAHLAPYLDDPRLSALLGPQGPGLVICLDSGCPTYDRLWVTTSMRGHLVASLRVDVLDEGVHSGGWGGVVPSSFRLLRRLLSRIEDERTGRVLVEECYCDVPPYRTQQIEALVDHQGAAAIGTVPRLPGASDGPDRSPADLARQVTAQTWQPSLAITGAGGLPTIEDGGSLIRPFTEVKLSVRLAPQVDPERAAASLRSALLASPPEGAHVRFEVLNLGAGFDAPRSEDWLEKAVTQASVQYFGQPAQSIGRGGTNPFLSTMRTSFPAAQILATGVLGPDANAHAPDEMLHVPTAERLTACIAHVVSQAP